MRLLAAAILSAMLTGAGPVAAQRGGEAELASAVGTRQPGKPVDCISPQDQTSVQVVEGTAIVYGYATRLYVNRPVNGAEALRRDDVLVTHIYSDRLCRNDIVTLLSPPSRIPRGSVRLGQFVPYGRPH